jgi:cysteine desulfurase
MKKIYMDNAATTPVDNAVLDAMLPYFSEKYGNASSLHSFGREAHEALDIARQNVATLLGAQEQEIIFTAGGTESDNIAIQGIALANCDKRKKPGPHIITSTIEHPAVLETCKQLEQQGYAITYIPVESNQSQKTHF